MQCPTILAMAARSKARTWRTPVPIARGGPAGLAAAELARHDLSGTWWAGFPGMDAAYGDEPAVRLITSLIGVPVVHQVLASEIFRGSAEVREGPANA
jgi:hypothetical protein